ncbi:MAG: ABC transporter ATP-binding protein [Halobacteriaceae archaeon]
MTRVTVTELTKEFGDPPRTGVVAVDDVSLEIADGELLVLLGPSGCGKTTMLRMIGGLETPTSGTVEFDGTVVNDVKARNRDVAMVFQDFALYPHMDVRGNLSFGLKREDNDLSAAEIDERVEEVAELLEIEMLLDNPPSELSGGQKQRVALGRAIVREPNVFLFDEPLANLDAKLRKTMRTEIEELQNQVGITSVYVTHNQEEAMTMADRIVVMDDGVLQQIGSPAETFNEPANRFVAEFIGSPSMNFFDATVERAGEVLTFSAGDISFEVPGDYVTESVGETAVVGFRPQDLYELDEDAMASVESAVRVVEPLGTEAIVHTETSEGELTATLDEFSHLERDTAITLSIDPRHVYLFDPETGGLLKGRQVAEVGYGDTADAGDVAPADG